MIDVELKEQVSIRERLYAATREVHERLHDHPRLKPLADGCISLEAYRELLGRLYGFHAAAEAAFAAASHLHPIDMAARRKAPLLREDLIVLGLDAAAVGSLPLCADLPPINSAASSLGCAYVVEGSTLGGRTLAKAVGPLLGGDAGRRFFIGYGDRHGEMWRAFTAALEAVPTARYSEMADAALATFAAFERWLD